LENLTRELQAAGEAYSANYYETETNAILAILSLEKAKEEPHHFNDGYREYGLDLRRQKRQLVGMMEDLRAIAEEELGDISLEWAGMQDAVDGTKSKKLFAEEKKKEENCKSTGQPLHADIYIILQRHGIDRTAQFGGALAGNGCRKLMAEADAIMKKIGDNVFQLPVQQRLVGTQDDIQAVCEHHQQLLLSFDGYFSELRTKRYHQTDKITMNNVLFRNRSLAIMRYLSMSVTPKDHCLEDHAVQLMVLHQEIGDLGEDQGEHNHQLESKEDLRLGRVRSFQRREVFKNKQDGKKHDPGVKEMITKMYDKHAKRKNAEETATRCAEERQKRISTREEALMCPAPESLMETLRWLRKNKMASN
jgi:hypothetical protein